MSERARASLLLAATALIWSSGGLAIKLVDLPPMAITGVRSALSALTLALLFRKSLCFTLSPARVCAALSYAALLVSNVAATKMTTAANAILLAYTAPVYVALLAPRLLGEKTRPADWLFIGVALSGMVLFFFDQLSPEGLWGNIVAVGSGLCYAAFTLSMRAQKDASPVESVLLGHVLTACVGLPFLLGTQPSAEGWAGLLYLGVIQQGFSLALYVWSIKRLGALEAILIMTLEPILNPVWVALGVGELPGFWSLLGGLVVLLAVTLRGVLQARAPAPKTPGQQPGNSLA
ncbi:MAG TPA: DMT family transporter [Humidesulfovibrio sp.]|uniref:DMT family transporter n=1 Tax=Humidesulfovibrio sp. TaxID=2910988 RepID=UPI002BDFCC25|nr:DMT family transporter [Humidesulfovibrio sp.]HWR03675.1 DMT family transporter [Humidesulfovibrio sp.]